MSENLDKKLREIKMVVLQDDTLTPEQLKHFLTAIIAAVNQTKTDFQSISKKNLDTIAEALELLALKHKANLEDTDAANDKAKGEMDAKLAEANKIVEEIKAMRPKDGDPGKDADETAILERVLERIPEPVKPDEVTGQSIVEKINDLEAEPEQQIDAKHIKNLPKMIKETGGVVGRNIYQMNDVNLTGIADGDILRWNGTDKRWENSFNTNFHRITVSATQPTSPQVNDLWVDIS